MRNGTSCSFVIGPESGVVFMALIICPECQSKVSSLASACMCCGFPISSYYKSQASMTQIESRPEIGSMLNIGQYRHKRTNMEPSSLQWIVLKHVGEYCLLVSRFCLEYKPFEGNVWAESELRKWLNEEFYFSAFTDEEKGRIPNVMQVKNDIDYYSGVDPIQLTDRVFLLSFREIKEFEMLISDGKDTEYVETLRCKRALEAKRCKSYIESEKVFPLASASGWWLRTHQMPYYPQYYSARDGYGERHPRVESSALSGVRPAIWLKSHKE